MPDPMTEKEIHAKLEAAHTAVMEAVPDTVFIVILALPVAEASSTCVAVSTNILDDADEASLLALALGQVTAKASTPSTAH